MRQEDHMTDDQAWRGRMGGMSPEEVEQFLAEGTT